MNGLTGVEPLEQSGALAREPGSNPGPGSGRLRMTPPGFTSPDGRRAADALGRHNGGWDEDIFVGDADAMVARLAPYLELGFRAFHVDLPAPFDEETLRRFAQEVGRASCRERVYGTV